MEQNLFLNRVLEYIKHNLLSFVLLCSGLILIIIGIVTWIVQYTKPVSLSTNNEFTTTASVNTVSTLTPTPDPDITVDVEGAVNNPGVYSLPGNSRVKDAIKLAGGLNVSADKVRISQEINLSAKLSDSMKIYVPAVGDSQTVLSQTGNQFSNISVSSSGPVNINTASLAELDNLPGVGQVTAQKIIDNRPYKDVSDLQTKKVVKSNVFAEIKDKVSVN